MRHKYGGPQQTALFGLSIRRVVLGSFALLAASVLSTAKGSEELAGSEWRPTEIQGTAVPAETEIFIEFGDGGQLNGHGGCNRFFGGYTISPDAIEIGPLGATRMACDEPVMDRELRFLTALDRAATFHRDRTRLTLSDADGRIVMRFVQTDAD